MSLNVHARRRVADGGPDEFVEETPAPPFNGLAGFEAWRHRVWGSPPVVRLGCTVLPLLAERDVFASGQMLEELERDVKLLQASLRRVVDELLQSGVPIVAPDALVAGAVPGAPIDPYQVVAARLANIAEAVRLAKAVPGGAGEVVIW